MSWMHLKACFSLLPGDLAFEKRLMEGSKEKKKTEAATERETKKKSDTLETSLLEVAVPPFSKCDNPDII